MNKIIETDRLIIREFVKDDLLSFHEIESNERILKFMPWYKKRTLRECSRQLKKLINRYDNYKLNSWAVTIKDKKEVIGITQLMYSDKIKGVEIGTKILPEYWNEGYASELTRAVINYGLNELKIDEITAVTNINNAGAIKSLINCGMKFKKYGNYNGSEVVFYSAKIV